MNSNDWKALHGLVLVVSFLPLALLDADLLVWPVPIAGPLVLYALIVAGVAPLRRTCSWLRPGRVSSGAALFTALLAVISSAVLIGYDVLFNPDLAHLDRYAPLDFAGDLLVSGIIFSIGNAFLEEAVFRGILFQAMEARMSWALAVLMTSILFGWGHAGGYPPGALGACLAGVYGLALGCLRHVSGGLLLPVAAHAVADATIFALRAT